MLLYYFIVITLITEKLEHAIINCINLVKFSVENKDKDMTRSYFEQLNDLIIEFLGE